VLRALEEIRCRAAEMLSIASAADATRVSPGLPKVAVVGAAAAYRTSQGREQDAESHDLHGRLMSMQTAHRAYAVTSAICTAVASLLPGTVVCRCRGETRSDSGTVRIAHPSGVIDVGVEMERLGASPQVLSARVGRTARLILSGFVHLPASTLET
jgi:2-methylaconitate cis-trans-isomerase PrpF